MRIYVKRKRIGYVKNYKNFTSIIVQKNFYWLKNSLKFLTKKEFLSKSETKIDNLFYTVIHSTNLKHGFREKRKVTC